MWLLMSRMRLTWVTSRSARRKFPLVARTIDHENSDALNCGVIVIATVPEASDPTS